MDTQRYAGLVGVAGQRSTACPSAAVACPSPSSASRATTVYVAGYGTTLVVAELMGRTAIGVEPLPERADLIRTRVAANAEVITDDARHLATLTRTQPNRYKIKSCRLNHLLHGR